MSTKRKAETTTEDESNKRVMEEYVTLIIKDQVNSICRIIRVQDLPEGGLAKLKAQIAKDQTSWGSTHYQRRLIGMHEDELRNELEEEGDQDPEKEEMTPVESIHDIELGSDEEAFEPTPNQRNVYTNIVERYV